MKLSKLILVVVALLVVSNTAHASLGDNTEELAQDGTGKMACHEAERKREEQAMHNAVQAPATIKAKKAL